MVTPTNNVLAGRIYIALGQARRQDSVTGGGRNKYWGGTRSLFCVNSRGARGRENFIPVWIKWTRWGAKSRIFRPKSEIQAVFLAKNRWSPKKKRSSLKLQGIFRPKSEIFRPKTGDLQKKKVFTEIAREFPAEIGNSSGFSGQKQVLSKQKRSSSQKRYKIWCQSTKNTNLDLDLRYRSPEPVTFFGAQSSLGRGTCTQLGGAAAVCPPWSRVGAGPLALRRFLQDLSAKCRGRPKKSYDLSAGPLAGTAPYYDKSGSG